MSKDDTKRVVGLLANREKGGAVKVTATGQETPTAAAARTAGELGLGKTPLVPPPEEKTPIGASVKTATPGALPRKPENEDIEPVGPMIEGFLKRVGEKRANAVKKGPLPTLSPAEVRKGAL